MNAKSTNYNLIVAPYAQHRQVHSNVLQSLIENGKIRQASRILEVGCGTGNYSTAIFDQTQCTCHGIDPSEAMLAQARKNLPQIHTKIGSAERREFPNNFLS